MLSGHECFMMKFKVTTQRPIHLSQFRVPRRDWVILFEALLRSKGIKACSSHTMWLNALWPSVQLHVYSEVSLWGFSPMGSVVLHCFKACYQTKNIQQIQFRNCEELFLLFCAKNPVKPLGRLSAFMQKLQSFHEQVEKMISWTTHCTDQDSLRQLCI